MPCGAESKKMSKTTETKAISFSLTINERRTIADIAQHSGLNDLPFHVQWWKDACQDQGKRLCPVRSYLASLKNRLDELINLPEVHLAWSLMTPKFDGTIDAPIAAQNILLLVAKSDELKKHCVDENGALYLPNYRRAKKILTELYARCR